jgi:hypothetical protein
MNVWDDRTVGGCRSKMLKILSKGFGVFFDSPARHALSGAVVFAFLSDG